MDSNSFFFILLHILAFWTHIPQYCSL